MLCKEIIIIWSYYPTLYHSIALQLHFSAGITKFLVSATGNSATLQIHADSSRKAPERKLEPQPRHLGPKLIG